MRMGSYEGVYAAWHENISIQLNHRLLPPCNSIIRTAPLIQWSKTDRIAWDALKEAAKIYLGADMPLPDDLKQWILDVLDGKLRRPTGKQSDPEILIRDVGVILAIEVLAAQGWTVSRNKSRQRHCCAEGGSAVDAVGVAINKGFSTVENIWTRRQSFLSPPKS